VRRASLALALLLAALPAAAEVVVSADASPREAALGGQISLTVTVSGDRASLPAPRMPALPEFSVYSAGSSQSYSWVNGKVSASVVHTYVLEPRSAGRFVVPAIGAPGAARESDPIPIVVSKTGAPAPAAPRTPAAAAAPPAPPEPAPAADRAGRRGDLFVVARLDRDRVYVNQQATLTVRFYYSDRVQLAGNSQYEAPSLTGFLSEDLPPVRTGAATIDGRAYHYSEVKTALFPVEPGLLKIGAATVSCQVAAAADNPFSPDFFDRFFSMGSVRPVTVRSDPLTLRALPPPAGSPAGFTGLVGRLKASLTADRTSVKAGDAVALTLELSGEGNVKSVPDPPKPDVPSLRVFDTQSTAQVSKTGDRIGGTKTFHTVVVPRVSGEIRVPPFRFPYFDPARKAYETAATQALVLRVAPGPAVPAGGGAAAPETPGLTRIADDVRYLKTGPESEPLSDALASFADLGRWHAVPFLILLAAGLADWRRRAAGADPRGRRFRDALRRAEERLKSAAALPEAEAARAAALTGEALAGFVADKLDCPAAGLTQKSAVEGLKALKRAPSAAALERLRAAWEEADLRRFAPGAAGSGGARSFAEEVAALLKALDQETAR
jgi:hypothetical protein